MKNLEIQKHEILKQAALYSYDVNKNKIPNGYKLVGISSHNNGFYACVLKKDNNIIIAYRGTNSDSWADLKNDISMGVKIKPEQAKNALNLYDQIHYEYPNCSIELTGHSLGGSLAQIVGATRNIETVTFNAHGTRNFMGKNKIYDDKIINYCNPKDWVSTRNAKNHIGKCYEIGSTSNNVDSHKIESMQPLENRVPTTHEELQGAWARTKRKQEELDYYRKTGKHMPIRMQNSEFSSNCIGSYSVSGYTREDGTKVAGYTRTCGAKHENGQKPSEKYKGIPVDKLSKSQIDELLNEMI